MINDIIILLRSTSARSRSILVTRCMCLDVCVCVRLTLKRTDADHCLAPAPDRSFVRSFADEKDIRRLNDLMTTCLDKIILFFSSRYWLYRDSPFFLYAKHLFDDVWARRRRTRRRRRRRERRHTDASVSITTYRSNKQWDVPFLSPCYSEMMVYSILSTD